MSKLTKRIVDASGAKDSEYFVWDRELKGFGLRVYPSGRKSFVLQYRSGGRTRRLNVGPYGPLTVEEARDLARQNRGDVAKGGDPSAQRAKERRVPTVAELCDKFLQDHASVRCKPTTQREYAHCCRNHIIPKLGPMRVTDVLRSDIAALHQSLHKTPYQANRVLATLSKMFNLAELWGYREEGKNPTRHIPKYKEVKRERFLSAEEIARLWATLDHRIADGTETVFVASAFKLLLLTGCRSSEIRLLKWAYLQEGTMLLPDSKTGRRRIPLSPACQNIIAAIPRHPDNPYVICGEVPGNPSTDLEKPWRRIREAAELRDVRIHDLRHTYASWSIAAGHSLFLTGKLLGHTQAETTNRYAHLADSTQRKAAETVDDLILSFVKLPTETAAQTVH